MGGPTLREVLNRLRWDPGANPAPVVLTVISREAGRPREREVSFADVEAILGGGVLLADGTFLPYHRVVAVRAGVTSVWCARERSGHGRA